METQNSSHEKCCAGSRRGKIIGVVILVVAIAAVLFVAAGAEKMNVRAQTTAAAEGAQNPNLATATRPLPYNPNDDAAQFALPQDATKSGEILMQVANADTISQNISSVASAHGGTIYATYSAHAPGDGVRSGFVVVQVDENEFDATYGALKNLASSIIQESTKTIPRYDYAVPMMSPSSQSNQTAAVAPSAITDQNATTPSTAVSNTVKTKEQTAVQPAIAIAPLPPIYSANKGYIKVNFVESPRDIAAVGRADGSMPFFTGYEGMGLRRNIWIVLMIKAIAVIILLFILFILLARFVSHMKQRRAARKKATVHIVRQQPKSRPRVVRIAKKK